MVGRLQLGEGDGDGLKVQPMLRDDGWICRIWPIGRLSRFQSSLAAPFGLNLMPCHLDGPSGPPLDAIEGLPPAEGSLGRHLDGVVHQG